MIPQTPPLAHDDQGWLQPVAEPIISIAVADIPAGDMLALICGNCQIEDCFAVDVCPLIEYLRERPALPESAIVEDDEPTRRSDFMGF